MAVTRSAMAPGALTVSRYRPSASAVARIPVPATATWAPATALPVASATRPDTVCARTTAGTSAHSSVNTVAPSSRLALIVRMVGILTLFIGVVRVRGSGNGEPAAGGLTDEARVMLPPPGKDAPSNNNRAVTSRSGGPPARRLWDLVPTLRRPFLAPK